MMKITKATLFIFLMSMMVSVVQAQSKESGKTLEPFPSAAEGMTRHVIDLKKKSDESKWMIEIIPGKVMSVDCNVHRLMGNIEEKTVEGWGYTYYEFVTNGLTTSTMMGCPGVNVDKFISGETKMLRYNSKLPIVIYTPKGYNVKYRIWKASKEKVSVEK